MNNINLFKFISLFGYLQSMFLTFLLFYLFFCAYTSDFSQTININLYGEAHIEWFIICILSCFILIGFYCYYKNLTFRNKKEV